MVTALPEPVYLVMVIVPLLVVYRNWASTAAGSANNNSSGNSLVAQAVLNRVAGALGKGVIAREGSIFMFLVFIRLRRARSRWLRSQRPHYSAPTARHWFSGRIPCCRSGSFGFFAFGVDPSASCNGPTFSPTRRSECGPSPFSKAAPWPRRVGLFFHLSSCSIMGCSSQDCASASSHGQIGRNQPNGSVIAKLATALPSTT